MDDLISRKDAINYMANAIWHYPNYSELNVYENAEALAKDGLANVPSAESTGAMDEAIQHYIDEGYMMLNRPKGEWILENVQNKEDVENNNYAFRCSECGYIDIHSKCVEVPFCWHCGASMVGDIE